MGGLRGRRPSRHRPRTAPNCQCHLPLLVPALAPAGYRDALRSAASSTTNKALNVFADWINDHCAAHGRPDGIPLVRKQHWPLSTSQFRRTLAWFIARRPGGAIAGAIQYRHHSIQMFEGYAGTSDSGFRAEVEAERTLERGERLLTMVEGHEQLDLRGPAAAEAQSRLANLERKVAHKALCRRPAATDGAESSPDLGTCQPLRCRHVALTEADLHALAEQLTKIEDLLHAGDALAPYVAHRLTTQRQDLPALLAKADTHPRDGQ